MKASYTHVSILLDRSGSMDSIADDTIGGFNQLIKEQKAEEGELTVTVASFASKGDYTPLQEFIPVDKVINLTNKDYSTSGLTALNDSFARLINETGARLAGLPENERPSKVLLISFTDGAENDSKDYTTEKLKEMIKHQEDKYGWQFLYMGANQDSFKEGVTQRGYTMALNFMADSVGTRSAYASMSSSLKSVRKTGKLDANDLKQQQPAINQDPNPLTKSKKTPK